MPTYDAEAVAIDLEQAATRLSRDLPRFDTILTLVFRFPEVEDDEPFVTTMREVLAKTRRIVARFHIAEMVATAGKLALSGYPSLQTPREEVAEIVARCHPDTRKLIDFDDDVLVTLHELQAQLGADCLKLWGYSFDADESDDD
jgi:hypothetical protein